MRLLRSKPVMIVGAGALASKIGKKVNKMSPKKRKRSKAKGAFSGLLAAGAAGGTFKYFTNPIHGPTRRSKVMKMVGLGNGENAEDRFTVHDSTTSEGL